MAFLDRLEHPHLRSFYDYWERKRGARLMPSRADIDPIEIPKLLPHLMLVDLRDQATSIFYRLAGTEIVTAFGTNPTGRYLDELASGEYREFILNLYQMMYRNRCPVFSENDYSLHQRGYARTMRLMVPLSRDGVEVDKALCIQLFSYGSPTKAVVELDKATHAENPVTYVAAGK